MAPKSKASTKSAHTSKAQDGDQAESKQNQPNGGQQSSKKRKQGTDSEEPSKAPRRSGRGAPKSQPSQEQLIDFLLSKEAENLCRPEDENQDMKTRGKIRTYSSSMNPFEELLSAVILSRPISHRLGLRSIRTILNDPYNFTSAKAVQAAGPEKHHQALWDARTQHKGKTAEQIGQIADVVLEKFTASGDKDGTQLQKVLDDAGGDVDKALDVLKESIKGLGATGVNIFLRRVQWLWSAGYPYVDDRTQLSLRKLGLPEDGADLVKAVDAHWSVLKKQDLAGSDEKAKKRRAYVTVLERAIGADLEGKIDAVLQEAGQD